MKVAIYARVSTNKQDNGNQFVELREFAAKQNWQIVTEYVDTASGSGKKDRVLFEGMMLAASQKQFDVVLFWKLDRFTREGTRKTLAYLTRLDAWGVAWRSYSKPFFDSCGIMCDVVISIWRRWPSKSGSTTSGRRQDCLGRSGLARSWAGHLTRWTWIRLGKDKRQVTACGGSLGTWCQSRPAGEES